MIARIPFQVAMKLFGWWPICWTCFPGIDKVYGLSWNERDVEVMMRRGQYKV